MTLPGTVFDANSGGRWGVALKSAGFDALIGEGAADHPVILEVVDGSAWLLDGTSYWGMDVPASTAALGGGGRSVACIGLAGEKLVLISSIMNDGTRALGRGGVGAAMWSKRLKAIVVSGSRRPDIADKGPVRVLQLRISAGVEGEPDHRQRVARVRHGGADQRLESGRRPAVSQPGGRDQGLPQGRRTI